MKILLWAEFQKLRRSNIILFTVFAIVFTAVFVFLQERQQHLQNK